MSDSFKSFVKPDKNGKIWPCKICNKTPNEGDEIWMQNLGDDTNKQWIVSPHEECFKKLQENPELGKSTKKPFVSQKISIDDAPKVFALAETLLESFKTKRGIQHDASTNNLTIPEELQAIESFFKTLSGSYKP